MLSFALRGELLVMIAVCVFCAMCLLMCLLFGDLAGRTAQTRVIEKEAQPTGWNMSPASAKLSSNSTDTVAQGPDRQLDASFTSSNADEVVDSDSVPGSLSAEEAAGGMSQPWAAVGEKLAQPEPSCTAVTDASGVLAPIVHSTPPAPAQMAAERTSAAEPPSPPLSPPHSPLQSPPLAPPLAAPPAPSAELPKPQAHAQQQPAATPDAKCIPAPRQHVWKRAVLDSVTDGLDLELPPYDQPHELQDLSKAHRKLFHDLYEGRGTITIVGPDRVPPGWLKDCFKVGGINIQAPDRSFVRTFYIGTGDPEAPMFVPPVSWQTLPAAGALPLGDSPENALRVRVCHLALHRFGYPEFPVLLYHRIVQMLGVEYKKAYRFTELANLMLVASRYNLAAGCEPYATGLCEQRLGEALEALGHYGRTAPLYNEIAENTLATEEESYDDLDFIFRSEGIAYKRAGQYDKAELALLRALHALGLDRPRFLPVVDSTIPYQTTPLGRTIGHMVANYWRNETTLDIALRLSGLFLCAGGERRTDWRATDKVCRSSIRVTGLANARDILHRLARCPTVEAFRELLANCRNPKFAIQLGHFTPLDFEAETLDNARRHASKGWVEEVEKIECFCCRTELNIKESMRCPCKVAYYCNAECQKSHWKVHKKTCAARKKSK